MGENIHAPYSGGSPFNHDEHTKTMGFWPKPFKRREEIEDLPPIPKDWKTIHDGFFGNYDVQQPYDDEFRVVVNSEVGGNSYFGAGKTSNDAVFLFSLLKKGVVAMLIYGDAKWWFWVRIQHLQYFGQVLDDESHIRHELYTRFNNERSGLCKFNLFERLGIADCWFDHR